jgi:hypothetical protein
MKSGIKLKKSTFVFSFLLITSIFSFLSTDSRAAGSTKNKIIIPVAGVTSFINNDCKNVRAGVSAVVFQKSAPNVSGNDASAKVVSTPLSDDIPACGNEYGYSHMGIAVEGGQVNVRESADENSNKIGKLPDGGACEIIGEEGDWYKIESGEVDGYVSKQYLLTGDAAIQRAKEFLTSNNDLKTSLNATEAKYGENVTDVRASVVEEALSHVGLKYVWGGTSLTRGADCSGLVLAVYQQFGINLPHYSGAQARYGREVSVGELKPGDLVFYGNRRISHVAIYIGNGCVVSALNPRKGVKVTGIYGAGNYKCSRSLLP